MTANITDKKYSESDEWKCSKSPTGSHYFKISTIKTGYSGKCKYCGKVEHYLYGRTWRRKVIANKNKKS